MPQPYKKARKNAKGAHGGVSLAVKSSQPCKFFQRGRCSNPNCPYLHVRQTPAELAEAARRGSAAGPSAGAAASLSSASQSLQAVLRLFFEKQQAVLYEPESRALNLSRLAQHEDLLAVAPSLDFNTRSFCEILCACIASLVKPPPQILCLDENNISSVYHLARAMEETGREGVTGDDTPSELVQSLLALSLAKNAIKTTDFARELKDFTSLVELNLEGNPAAELPDYKQKIKRFLPLLRGLDGRPVRTPPLALPWPRFYHADSPQTSAAGAGAPIASSAPRRYDAVQREILCFLRERVLSPWEGSGGDPAGGAAVCGADAVCEAYALNATLTFTLTAPEAAVTTPASRVPAGGSGGGGLRSMVREVVGLRLRQTEGDHNLQRGGAGHGRKALNAAQVVAVGRTKVCAQLEHWLYPRSFAVLHCLHDSPDVVVLDNNGFGPDAVVGMKEPVAVATLHGVMRWQYRPDGPHTAPRGAFSDSASPATGAACGSLVIERGFSRSFTLVQRPSPAGNTAPSWQIAGDLVSLLPFAPSDIEESPDGEAVLPPIQPHDIVFTPASTPARVARLARVHDVPTSVVGVIAQHVASDLELAEMLSGVQGVSLDTFEQCALLVAGNPMASVLLCRLGNRYGVDPQTTGVALLQQFGLDWPALERAVGSKTPSP